MADATQIRFQQDLLAVLKRIADALERANPPHGWEYYIVSNRWSGVQYGPESDDQWSNRSGRQYHPAFPIGYDPGVKDFIALGWELWNIQEGEEYAYYYMRYAKKGA